MDRHLNIRLSRESSEIGEMSDKTGECAEMDGGEKGKGEGGKEGGGGGEEISAHGRRGPTKGYTRGPRGPKNTTD